MVTRPIPTPEQNEEARRNARLTYAKRRIQHIVDGMPALTAEQRAELAEMLSPGRQAAEEQRAAS